MSEFYTPGVRVFAAHQIQEAEQIGMNALELVEERFGSGYPTYNGGENGGLAYHNRHHSQAVQHGTEAMGNALGLSQTEITIGRIAASAHDIVQLKQRGVMERESADWLEEQMKRKGIFPAFAVTMGSLAILGTEPVFEGGQLVGQIATTQSYPSRSAELVSKSVACADLGELFSPAGPLLGHDLYKEINGVNQVSEPSMDKLINFQRGQVSLTENYEYPHPEGERVFGSLRSEVASYSAHVLGQLEQGLIETWDQLLAQDRAFMTAHS